MLGPAWAQGGPAEPAAEAAPAGPGLRWQVPPVAVSGTVGYELRLDHSPFESHRRQQLLTATVNAASYLYQPWFATVGGTLAFTAGHTSQGGEAPSGERDRFVTGALRLALFPRSRFPLEARYEVADSRTDSALGGAIDYRATTVALTQRYRPAKGDFSLSASFEHRAQDGLGLGHDTQQSWLLDFSTRFARQQLAASLSRSINRREATGEQTDFWSVVGRHSHAPGGELTVESTVNWGRTDDRLQDGHTALTLSQWSSVALWRPESRPLTVSASVRGFRLDSSDAGLASQSTALGLGVSYELAHNLRLNANATATRLDGQTQTALVGSLGASVQGDTRQFAGWNHDWFGGLTLSSAHNAAFSEHSIATQLGQTVSRVWLQGEGSTLTASFGQTLSLSRSTGGLEVDGQGNGLARALSHTAALTWSAVATERSAYARVSLADARQFDGERSRFTLFNAQLTGNWELDRNRGWSGDLTLQRVFQRALLTPLQPAVDVFGFSRSVTTTASGEFTWRQQRVFDVPRLRFTSRLRLSHDAQSQTRALIALPDRETATWENRLDWQVGRLETGLALRLSQQDGQWREFLQWRVLRSFGD